MTNPIIKAAEFLNDKIASPRLLLWIGLLNVVTVLLINTHSIFVNIVYLTIIIPTYIYYIVKGQKVILK